MEWESSRKFSILKKVAFDTGSTICLNLEKDTCHSESKCYETALRFNKSLREIFFESGSSRVMKKYDESVLMRILQEFGTP